MDSILQLQTTLLLQNCSGASSICQKNSEFVDALRACPYLYMLTFRRTPNAQDLHETDERRLELSQTRTGSELLPFGVPSSFAYILSLVEEANSRPMWLKVCLDMQGPTTRGCGLTNCAALAETDVLCEVVELCLQVYLEKLNLDITTEEAYLYSLLR
jgi:hypothetical protein